MTDTHTAELHYDAPLVRLLAANYWRRTAALWFASVAMFGLVPLVVGLVAGDDSWIVGAFGGLFVASGVFAPIDFRREMAKAEAYAVSMGQIRLVVSPTDLSLEHALGVFRLPWDRVRSLVRTPDGWYFVIDRDWPTMLPTRQLDESIRQAIESACRERGARIDG